MSLKRFDLFIRVTDKGSTNGGAVMVFIDGPFTGVEFAINRVKIKDNVLDFHYDVMSNHTQLIGSKDFENELGDLVVYLLENPDIKIGKNVAPTPNNNPPKSNS